MVIKSINRKPKIIKEVNLNDYVVQIMEIDGECEIYLDGQHIDRFKMLVFALNAPTKQDAWNILNQASRLYHHRNDFVFNDLYEVVAMEITRKYSKNKI